VSDACPKCGGTSGKVLVETIKRERYEAWDGEHLGVGDETAIDETRWRCQDCNAYKISQHRPSLSENERHV
jgi:hypothetical protein